MITDFSFDAYFKPKHKFLNCSERKGYGGYLNLKSNELHHCGLDILCREFIDQYEVGHNRSYPIHSLYKKKLADFYRISYDQFLLASGSNFLIHQILELMLGNINNLILQSPNYITYHDYPVINNIEITEVKYAKKTEKEFIQELMAVIDSARLAAVVLTNPNGFTGELISLENMETVAKRCLAKNILLVIDEAYVEFSGIDHLCLLKYKNVVIIRTLSKSFGFAGLRAAFMFGAPEVVEYLRKFGVENTLSNFVLEYLIFLHDNIKEVLEIQNTVINSRNKLIEYLTRANPTWHVYKTSTNFVSVAIPSNIEFKRLLDFFDKNNIVVRDLSEIANLDNHLRITVGDDDIFQVLINVFKEFK